MSPVTKTCFANQLDLLIKKLQYCFDLKNRLTAIYTIKEYVILSTAVCLLFGGIYFIFFTLNALVMVLQKVQT